MNEESELENTLKLLKNHFKYNVFVFINFSKHFCKYTRTEYSEQQNSLKLLKNHLNTMLCFHKFFSINFRKYTY